MVRTLRSIEEEARVHRVSGPGTDAILADPGLSDLLEGERLAALLSWAKDGARRALVVGLEDRGRIALELAKAGIFVTIVDPDERLQKPVMDAADEARCSIRMNFYASDYMKREFAASGFDLIIFFSALGRYNEPIVVLKKASRELRAGGRVYGRLRVRPPVEPILARVRKIPGAPAVLAKAAELVARLPGVSVVAALPEADEFLADVGEVFKVEKSARFHLAAPVVAWLSREPRVPAPAHDLLARALPAALKADRLVLRAGPARVLATHLEFFGCKELQLGKTFRV